MINAVKLGSFVAAPDTDPYLNDWVETANDLIKAYTDAAHETASPDSTTTT